MIKADEVDREADRAASFLVTMPAGNTTVTRTVCQRLLLKYDGRLTSRGRLYEIMSRKVGPGVYRIWLEPWKSEA